MRSKNRYRSLSFYVIVILLVYGFTCNDCEDELYDSAAVVLELSDVRKSYSVGDTISISTMFGSMVTLERTQQEIAFAGGFHRVGFDFSKLVENQSTEIEALDAFQLIDSQVAIVDNQGRLRSDITVTGDCDDNCTMEFFVIPKESGIYVISITFGDFYGGDDCMFISMNPIGFDTADLNFNLFEELGNDRLHVHGSIVLKDKILKPRYFFLQVED